MKDNVAVGYCMEVVERSVQYGRKIELSDIRNVGDHDYEDGQYPQMTTRDLDMEKYKTEYNL